MQQTLRSLYEAVNALDNPDALSILNIDEDLLDSPSTTLEYVGRCRAWTQLRNIAKSIPDLLNQSESTALVGFLGHFSSGKSSLINALLGISPAEHPGYRREVGQHPTDTRITIITHRDHAQFVQRSAYTAIDAVDVVHGPALPFLEHATLVDTPGLGNEAAEHDAVIRFLHLCHVLVITIDGRRPFADKDKDFELLDTAFNKLDGVPKILVVTSAEEFLTTRTASFEEGWQADQAAAFWAEALARLGTDPRFRNQLDRFRRAPRFFVDSKEGFQVGEVRNALLPIVTNDGHRSRIRQAQGHYVLATAADALHVLLAYISTRSANLNRMSEEAEERAENTAIAVDALLESLEKSFTQIRQRLNTSRQDMPARAFAIEGTVTPEAIRGGRGPKLEKLEDGIRKALERQLHDLRRSASRRLRRHYMARTRAWFPATDSLDVQALFGKVLDVGRHDEELATVSIKCGRGVLRVVERQLATAAAKSKQHLRLATEAWEIGTRANDIETALQRFERLHDDSVRSFYAYISAPSSSDLLREHGFVGFDESGAQAVHPESIQARTCGGFNAISQASVACKQRLGRLRHEEPDDLDLSPDADEGWSIEESVFDDKYSDNVAGRVSMVCQRRVEDFVSDLLQRLARLVDDVGEERERVARSRARTWRARLTLAVRSGVAGLLLFVAAFGFSTVAPEQFGSLMSMLSGRLLESILIGSLSTVLVLVLVYVVAGARNESVRRALRPIVLDKLALRTKRRRLAGELNRYFDESYDALIGGVDDMSLQVDQAIADGVVDSLKNRSGGFRQAEQALDELRQVIVRRCELLDEFIEVVNEHLDQIPKELRDAAGEIRRDAIGKHMSRIRNAASSVEEVKSDVERIAEIAMHAH